MTGVGLYCPVKPDNDKERVPGDDKVGVCGMTRWASVG